MEHVHTSTSCHMDIFRHTLKTTHTFISYVTWPLSHTQTGTIGSLPQPQCQTLYTHTLFTLFPLLESTGFTEGWGGGGEGREGRGGEGWGRRYATTLELLPTAKGLPTGVKCRNVILAPQTHSTVFNVRGSKSNYT